MMMIDDDDDDDDDDDGDGDRDDDGDDNDGDGDTCSFNISPGMNAVCVLKVLSLFINLLPPCPPVQVFPWSRCCCCCSLPNHSLRWLVLVFSRRPLTTLSFPTSVRAPRPPILHHRSS